MSITARAARLLLQVLHDREADVLRFVHDLKVPPTSNQAERDLRPSKVQQNILGRLTSENRTRDRYKIRGYASTAANATPQTPQSSHNTTTPKIRIFRLNVCDPWRLTGDLTSKLSRIPAVVPAR